MAGAALALDKRLTSIFDGDSVGEVEISSLLLSLLLLLFFILLLVRLAFIITLRIGVIVILSFL